MNAPPVAPFFKVTMPMDSSSLRDSLTAWRLISKVFASSRSLGRRSPTRSAPARTCARICSLTASKVRRVLTAASAMGIKVQ